MATELQRVVTVKEGIGYGFRLLGYALAVALIGGFLIALGVSLLNDPYGGTGFGVIGPVFVLVGVVVFYAGALGLGYKVIADGVATGINMSE